MPKAQLYSNALDGVHIACGMSVFAAFVAGNTVATQVHPGFPCRKPEPTGPCAHLVPEMKS